MNRGKNAQALLTAPNPERRPRTMIPRNTSLERVVATRPVVAKVSGRGIRESKNR